MFKTWVVLKNYMGYSVMCLSAYNAFDINLGQDMVHLEAVVLNPDGKWSRPDENEDWVIDEEEASTIFLSFLAGNITSVATHNMIDFPEKEIEEHLASVSKFQNQEV